MFQPGAQGRRWGCTRLPGDHHSADNHHQCGYRLDSKPRREPWCPVHIDFDQLDPSGLLGRQLVKDRTDQPAGSAPFRPEVDQCRDR